jgi:hypothetical protein
MASMLKLEKLSYIVCQYQNIYGAFVEGYDSVGRSRCIYSLNLAPRAWFINYLYEKGFENGVTLLALYCLSGQKHDRD